LPLHHRSKQRGFAELDGFPHLSSAISAVWYTKRLCASHLTFHSRNECAGHFEDGTMRFRANRSKGCPGSPVNQVWAICQTQPYKGCLRSIVRTLKGERSVGRTAMQCPGKYKHVTFSNVEESIHNDYQRTPKRTQH
jgi:hypothetical protein